MNYNQSREILNCLNELSIFLGYKLSSVQKNDSKKIFRSNTKKALTSLELWKLFAKHFCERIKICNFNNTVPGITSSSSSSSCVKDES